MAQWWDPVGTNTADYGKVYLFCQFDAVPATMLMLR